jgi:alpha-L-fucosidase
LFGERVPETTASSREGEKLMTTLRAGLLSLPLICALASVGNPLTFAQEKRSQEQETDPLVLKKLEWFQDMKFGLLMHWGPYSQWGVVESWSLCPEDEGWCQRRGPYAKEYWEYKKAYENLQTTFNPVRFDPELWAAAAKGAGMRYVVFTAKHHDGFCMFDTKSTDYKITDKNCPFSTNPSRNAAREIFRAFRNQGFGIGAYFSKPDWHAPDYWWSYFPPLDRNVNYDVRKYPRRWESFKKFTQDQIRELMSEYGSMDILWLDGGWVNPANKNQDIDMPRIAAMARSLQPGLIVVDRAVPGRYENYRTPEQEVPEKPLDYVWETCMTMATSWSYVPNDKYKPARQLVHLLVDVVAKGGNFLLNIGPSPDGELPPVSLQRLKEIGDWMKVNAGAIYSTRPIAPYVDGKVRFTRSPNGAINAIYLADENESRPPETVAIASGAPAAGGTVSMLGVRESLQWERRGNGFVVRIPESIRNNPPCNHAWTLCYKSE